MQDPATWAAVAGVDHTSDHVHEGEILSCFRFTTRIGGVMYRGNARVTDARREQAMTLAIRTNELTGAITVLLTGTEPGTALEVGMRMQPTGILGSMLFPVLKAAVSEGFPSSVERFAREMG